MTVAYERIQAEVVRAMTAEKTEWVKSTEINFDQAEAITSKRFGRAHKSNWPDPAQVKYWRFWLRDGNGYKAGDVCGWRQ